MSVRQRLHQLAGKATVPYSVIDCCEVDKHSSGLLFSRKTILDVLCQQGGLICGRPPVWKAPLFPREQWVHDWVDTSVEEYLEDFIGGTQHEFGTITFASLDGFSGIGIATISALVQIFGMLSWRMQERRKSQNQEWSTTRRGV